MEDNFGQENYCGLNTEVSLLLKMFKNPELSKKCTGLDDELDVKKVFVGHNKSGKIFLGFLGTQGNKNFAYHVYEFEVKKLVDKHEVVDKGWTNVLRFAFAQKYPVTFEKLLKKTEQFEQSL